uniref:Uncharacterized protein n=1 Tax=Panagrolaimus sp. ES5 TaxID=591445 RepID=A0AC34GMV4_9BILA
MKLRSGKVINKSDVDMIDFTNDNIQSTTADPNATYTFKNPRPQEFSLPYPLMKYITMKSTSYKAWRKLITTCKYFYSKNPVIPIRNCQKSKYNDYEWSLSWTPRKYKLIDLRKKFCYKLWPHGHLEIADAPYSILAPKVFRYDLTSIYVLSQTISYDEYQRLTSSKTLSCLMFFKVNVVHSDGSLVAFDKLLENLPNASKIRM